MKRNIKKAALTTLSAFLFLETAVSYPAVAFAAEEEMAASFDASEASLEDNAGSLEETEEDESRAEYSGDVDTPDPDETAEEPSEEASGETAAESSENISEDASENASENASEDASEEEIVIEEEAEEDKLLNSDQASGYCGDDVTWEYDKAQGLLKISGSGAMYDYSEESPAPWQRYVKFITSVEVCEGVTHLGAYSFWTDETKGDKAHASSMMDEEKDEDYPDQYSDVDRFIFKKVVLPQKSLTSIGKAAFSNIYLDDDCTLTIPGTITMLPDRAFYRLDGDYYDSEVVLPDCIKVIGKECFADGLSGVNVNIPKNVEIIKDYAFRYNVFFEELKLPASLKEIGAKAFQGQIVLSKVWFEGDAPVVGEKAFITSECNAYYKKGNKTFTSEKQSLLGKTFEAVCWREYDNKAIQVTSGKAGANVTFTIDKGNLSFVGTGAMYDYTQDRLPEWAYNSYGTISIDSRITSIGDYCFFGVKAGIIDAFPTKLTKAGKYSFCEFNGKFKDNGRNISIEKVDDHAFQNVQLQHQNSTRVKLEDATYLGRSAVSRTFGYGPSVDISKVTYFGDYALFTGDVAEGSSFSSKVTYIGDGAFASTRCTGKLKVKLPSTLTYLGKEAFISSEYLENEAEINGTDLLFAARVFDYTPVNSVILGAGVTAIAQDAFELGNGTESTVKFLGNKPEFIINDPKEYGDGKITCYYPADNETWTGIREGQKWNDNAYKYDEVKYIPYGDVLVRFYNAKGEKVDTVSLPPDGKVAEPSADKRGVVSGQEFTGWYTDKSIFSDETKWDFSKPVPYTMNLYAGIKRNTCILKLVDENGKTLETLTFEKGENIGGALDKATESYSRSDRIIKGWFKDKAGSNKVYDVYYIKQDTVLYAKWSKEGLYLVFDNCMEGYVPTRKFVEYGTDTGLYNYRDFFRGWYKNKDYSGDPVGPVINKGDVKAETVLYAKWELVDSARITVTGYDSTTDYTGAAITFPNLKVSDRDKVLTLGKDYTVKYQNNKKIGKGHIILTFTGDYTGTKIVNFFIQARNLAFLKNGKKLIIDNDNSQLVANGKYQMPKPVIYEKRGDKYVTLKEKTDYVVTYKNADPKKSDYNPDAFKAPGLYTINIVGVNTYTGSITSRVTITDDPSIKAIKDLRVAKIKDTTLDADGKLIKPEIKIYDGKKLLRPDFDYTLKFDEPAVIGVNKVKVGSVFKNGYQNEPSYVGNRYLFFNVKASSINKTVVTGFESKLSYNGGDPVEQSITLYKDKASAKKGTEEGRLTEGRDYTVTYKDNIYPGKATMVITGTDKVFSGTLTKTFTISGESIAKAKVDGIESKTYTGSEIVQKNLKLFFQKNSKSEKIYLEPSMEETAFYNMKDSATKRAVCWTYKYGRNVMPGTATIVIKGVNGYTGTLKKTFKIEAISRKTDESSFAMSVAKKASYTKGGACPKPVVTYRKQVLTEGKDYKLTYKNNKKIGQTAAVTVTLKGGFKGTLSGSFEVTKGDISKCRVEANDVDTDEYRAKRKTQVAVYDVNGSKLAPGTDYDPAFDYLRDGVEFDPRSEKLSSTGTVEIVVHGKGNYAGTEVKSSFRIASHMLDECKLYFSNRPSVEAYKEYTGAPIEFLKSDIIVKVKYSDGKYYELKSSNYDIVGYRNNVELGTGIMIIKGKGSYGGTREIKFKITRKNVK